MKTAHKTDKSNNFEPSKSFVYATEENGEASVQLNGKKKHLHSAGVLSPRLRG